jgi:hypothetical protein
MKDIKKAIDKIISEECNCSAEYCEGDDCELCVKYFAEPLKSLLEGIVKDVEDKEKLLCNRLDKELNKDNEDSHLIYELEVEIRLTKEILSKIYKRLDVEV